MNWFSDSIRRLGFALPGTPPAKPQDDAPRPARPGRGPLGTDSGMFAVWDREPFRGIVDYDTWEPELLETEDIERHIRAAHLVPVNIQSDGVFEFEVRVGSENVPAQLGERERRYLTVSSEPYLFRAPNGVLHVSGIEHVGATVEPASTLSVAVAPGDHAVTVHMLEWDAEPGARGPDGRPTSAALPDFVILANPTSLAAGFRQRVETFDRPSDEESGG